MTTPANPDDLAAWLRWVLDQREAEARLLCSLAGVSGTYLRDLLAEVDAMRRILDRHRPRLLKAQTFRPAMLQCEHCADLCHSRSGLGCDEPIDEPIDAPWPCPDVCDLASVFAAREGFREEWRPA